MNGNKVSSSLDSSNGQGTDVQRLSPELTAGPDGPSTGVLRRKTSVLGKDAQWEEIRRSVRRVPQLRAVDHSKGNKCHSSNAGLHHLRPSQGGHGTSSSEGSPIDVSQPSRGMFLETAYEMKLLQSCRHHMPQNNGKGIDLLEVYASPHSKLTEEINTGGGTAKRFTKQDGDLCTFGGQVKLLRWVFKLNPKHIWVAPECAPWSAWNKFNQMRGVQAFCRIQDQQNSSRDHLALSRIQYEKGRHFHIENPDQSGVWQQDEAEGICRRTKPAIFDKCQFGLQHPLCKNQCRNVHVSRRHQKKCFKPWTTVYVNMITHTHAQIAGSCRLDGKSVQVSRFAAFYPRVLAKKLAEVTIHPVHKHVDVPAAVNFHTCLPVRALEHPENSNESLPKRARGNDDVPKTEKPPRKKRRYEEPSPVKVNDQNGRIK